MLHRNLLNKVASLTIKEDDRLLLLKPINEEKKLCFSDFLL
ncbi:hypothetical protein RV14_GL000818 [Enterococcus ratti]|uniref:Uncharacterized protein n=1 Tax=Enterococcus ratti TaxID=150033 RepID=A0A1L8WF59_9ENTE|nr:hypothetical protein RV14_GL000818 [Enterococcus ratti]